MRHLSLLFIGLLFLSACQTVRQNTADLHHGILSAKRPTIVVDPGHGGDNLGAHSKKYQYAEKNFALMTAMMLKDHLESLGYNVVMTRYKDHFISLKKRTEIANDIRADLFISIHYNTASNKEAHGLEVFYTEDRQNVDRTKHSKALASKILKGMLYTTGANDRGVKEANLAVTRGTIMPAVLVEGGFLSNAQERAKLKDANYLNRIAWGIAKGVHQYMR